VTSSDGSWDEEPEQKEYLLRPDPARPDFIFLDEDFAVGAVPPDDQDDALI
jgi:hypothetical protein